MFQNHVVERFWPDVNRLVNYPIKGVLNRMVQRDEIDLGDVHDRYIISQVALELTSIAHERFVQAWNHKNIPSMFFS